jgi:hypothetical protein
MLCYGDDRETSRYRETQGIDREGIEEIEGDREGDRGEREADREG